MNRAVEITSFSRMLTNVTLTNVKLLFKLKFEGLMIIILFNHGALESHMFKNNSFRSTFKNCFSNLIKTGTKIRFNPKIALYVLFRKMIVILYNNFL